MANRDSILIRALQNITDNKQWEQVYLPYFKIESRKGDWLNGNCPLSRHGGNDKNPSFGVNVVEGTYNCFVCGGGDAVDFLMDAGRMNYDGARNHLIQHAGITENQKHLTTTEQKNGYFDKKIVKGLSFNYIKSYIYTQNGTSLYRKNRYERIDNSGEKVKTFDIWQYSNGAWKPSAKNVKRVLYKSENISKSIEQHKPIFLCEGEKDVDTLTECRYFAVTAGGVNEWQSYFAKEFKGCNVIIIPDNDVPGINAAERAAVDLVKAGVIPLIVDWNKVTLVTGSFPGECKQKHGEDISDMVDFIAKKHSISSESALKLTVEIIIRESNSFDDKEKSLADKDLLCDFELNDTGNALRLMKLHGADIRFCPEWNYWLYYKGFWAYDLEGYVQAKIRDTISQLKEKAMEQGNRDALSFAIKSGNFSRQKSMLEVAKNYVEYGIPVVAKYWDGNHGLICLKNCTIDTKIHDRDSPFEIRTHRREDYITNQLEFEYDQNATCPLWEKFLSEVLPDREVISFIQRAVGYSMTGDTSEDAIFILWGSGQNGKSTLVDVLCEMLGDYAKTINPDTLMHKERNNTPNTEIARVRGTRLVRTSEADEGKRISESMIKILTSGEPVSARFLYGHDFEYKPTYKIWFSTNHKPVIRGSDNGIWRRIFLIPFEITIAPEKKDGSLDMKLMKEISGIFNWALEGLKEWKNIGLCPPGKVQEAVAEYRREQDVLAGFLEECIVQSQGNNVVAGKLFERYIKYCDANNLYKLSSTAFGRKMVEKGYNKSKVGSNVLYHNIELIQSENDGFMPIDDKDCPF